MGIIIIGAALLLRRQLPCAARRPTAMHARVRPARGRRAGLAPSAAAVRWIMEPRELLRSDPYSIVHRATHDESE